MNRKRMSKANGESRDQLPRMFQSLSSTSSEEIRFPVRGSVLSMGHVLTNEHASFWLSGTLLLMASQAAHR